MNASPYTTAGVLNSSTISFLHWVIPYLSMKPEPHVVGGFLRDVLLDRSTNDLDLVIDGDALVAASHLANVAGGTFIVLDEARQIARVVLSHKGETWRLDLSSMNGDLLENLARRDFTIDAMSIPLGKLLADDWQESIVDPFGGRADLEANLVRVVTPDVFKEDGGRLLRAVRLAASLSFNIEAVTRCLIRRDATFLSTTSGERIRDELLAILSSFNAVRHVYILDELKLLSQIFPELEEGRGVTQPKEHYWDVFWHNVETVGAIEGLLERTLMPAWILEPVKWNEDLCAYFHEVVGDGHTRSTLLKLAGLLHDISKPATRSVSETGRIRFYGHHSHGAIVAHNILQRLRMSKRSAHIIETSIEYHLRPGQMSQGTELPTDRAVYRYFRSAGEVAIDILYLNLSDYVAARGPLLEKGEWDAYANMVRYIMKTGLTQKKTPEAHRLIDGHRLMKDLNLNPGPLLGQLLQMISEAEAIGEVTTKDEALALAKEKILTGDKEETFA